MHIGGRFNLCNTITRKYNYNWTRWLTVSWMICLISLSHYISCKYKKIYAYQEIRYIRIQETSVCNIGMHAIHKSSWMCFAYIVKLISSIYAFECILRPRNHVNKHERKPIGKENIKMQSCLTAPANCRRGCLYPHMLCSFTF